jgi:hypothetical protein
MNNDASKELISPITAAPETSGFGTRDAGREASRIACNSAARIASQLGDLLGRSELLKALAVFRRTLLPPRHPGRRRQERITKAHEDWKAGMPRVALYRAHIRNWEKHNRYRRGAEEKALMDAIRSRERRAEKHREPNGPEVGEPITS